MMRSAGDAASLQQDLARRFGLPRAAGPTVRRQRQISASSVQTHQKTSSSVDGSTSRYICHDCGARNNWGVVCVGCGGGGVRSSQEMSSAIVALATQQKLGLDRLQRLENGGEDQQLSMSGVEWSALEVSLGTRGDARCPICMEAFRSHEVLLSCSHMFHRACLAAFERLVRPAARRCPICRSGGYQKRVTHLGSRAYELECAVRVQAMWRGVRARRVFAGLRRALYQGGGGDPRLRRRHYGRELRSETQRLGAERTTLERDLAAVIECSETTLSQGRALDAEFDQMLRARGQQQLSAGGLDIAAALSLQHCLDQQQPATVISEEQWADKLALCLSRGVGECAICMCPIARHHHQHQHQHNQQQQWRRAVLLSCSHVFHDKCIGRFELLLTGDVAATAAGEVHSPTLTSYTDNYKTTGSSRCPVCRSAYQKRLLAADHCHFI